MTKHLHISVKIPLAEDPFEQAEQMVAAKTVKEMLEENQLPAGAIVAHEIVTEKPPRKKPAADAPKPARKPKTPPIAA